MSGEPHKGKDELETEKRNQQSRGGRWGGEAGVGQRGQMRRRWSELQRAVRMATKPDSLYLMIAIRRSRMTLAKPVFSKAGVQEAETTELGSEWVERNTGREILSRNVS